MRHAAERDRHALSRRRHLLAIGQCPGERRGIGAEDEAPVDQA